MASEYENFLALTSKVLSVSKQQVTARIREHKEQSLANPKRRGPKRKTFTLSASHGPDASKTRVG
jgi:hypothetical protein